MTFDVFPAGGLASSVITTVWVGVFIVVMLNLRFGTTLSGLVIPGYLVPIVFSKPISAGVVIFEGVVTYFVTLLIAQFAMKRFGYCELFGRDRFFALIVVSVLVRIVFDYWILPNFGEWIETQGWQFDHRNHLQSFGLIIVALIANQLWNSGIKIGSTVLALYLSLTFFAIKFILIPYTNFNIAEVGYMYEHLAQSLLASPKAYIILIITAFIASRMNLFYGWEFSGILIPSLLALQWYQPEKLLFTFVETLIILILGHVVTKLPLFRNTSFEGGKLLLLFFNIAFIYKMLLGFVLIEFYPSVKITDFYGFGYLISTLLAMKMYQKNIIIQMTRATIQTSFVAVLLASILGFVLSLTATFDNKPSIVKAEYNPSTATKSLQKFYTDFRPELFKSSLSKYYSPTKDQQDIFIEAWILLKKYQKQKLAYQLDQAIELFERVDYRVTLLEDKYLLISENTPQRGWGLYALNLQPTNGLVIEVPDGLTEKYADSASLRLFEHFQASAIVISTSKLTRDKSGISDITEYPDSLFQSFHNVVADNNVLQVRGFSAELSRKVIGKRQLDNKQGQRRNTLWTKNQLPEDLQLQEIEQWLKQVDVHFSTPPFNNLQRDSSFFGFAEILLTDKAIKRILVNTISSDSVTEFNYSQQIEGHLQSWLLNKKTMIARKGSESYQDPELSELLFWDEEIITPLLDLTHDFKRDNWSKENSEELKRLGMIVSAYNYQLTRYVEKGQSAEYLILSEMPGKKMKHWGTFIMRLTSSTQFFVQVPHPLLEESTFEFSTAWFTQLKARYLLLAGSHMHANKSERSNMSRAGNNQTIFQLFNQVVQRHYLSGKLLPVQIRSFKINPGIPYPKEDIHLSFWQTLGIPTSPSTARELYDNLASSGLSISLFDGDIEDSQYDVGYSQQSYYSQISSSNAFASIWLSPQIKYRYKNKANNSFLANHAKALGLEIKTVDIKSWLAEQPSSTLTLTQQTVTLLNTYQKQKNILKLRQLVSVVSIEGIQILLDSDSGQEFLLLLDQNKKWQALFNTNAINASTVQLKNMKNMKNIASFINQRNSLLMRGI